MIPTLFVMVTIWIGCFDLIARFFGPILRATPHGELVSLIVGLFALVLQIFLYIRRKLQSHDLKR